MNLEEQIAQTLLKKFAQIAEERHLSEEEISDLIDVSFTDSIRAMSDGMVSRFVQQISEMIEQERGLRTDFEQRLYARWHEALDLFDAGIVNLVVGMKESDELEGGKALKTNEQWGDLCGYAICFPPVTSFQV